jgi:hypothetical protein
MRPLTNLAIGAFRAWFSRVVLGATVVAVCGFALTTGACTPSADDRPRFVVVLIDETESFAKYWDKMIEQVQEVPLRLQPRGGMVVIAIDDEGFQPDDVLIDVAIIPEAALEARRVKDALREKVALLTRQPPKQRTTDVLGAIRQAADYAKRYRDPDGDAVIMAFSDMQQTPRMPTAAEARDLAFPSGTAFHAFFVDATGYQAWNATLRAWQEILTNAGAPVSAANFHQKGQTSVEIERLFASGGIRP